MRGPNCNRVPLVTPLFLARTLPLMLLNEINPFNINSVVCSFKLLLIRMLSGTEKLRRKVSSLSLCAEVLHSYVTSLYNPELYKYFLKSKKMQGIMFEIILFEQKCAQKTVHIIGVMWYSGPSSWRAVLALIKDSNCVPLSVFTFLCVA